jgi:hypothetical protein
MVSMAGLPFLLEELNFARGAMVAAKTRGSPLEREVRRSIYNMLSK